MKGNANLLRYNLMFGWNSKRFTLSNYIPACRQANWIGSYLNKIFKARYLRLLFPLATIMWSKILIQSFGERFLRLVIFIYSDFWYSWRFKILSKILFRYKLLNYKTNKATLKYSNLFSITSLFSFLPYTKFKLKLANLQSKSKSKVFFPKLLKIALNKLFFKRKNVFNILRLKNNFKYKNKNFPLFFIVLKYFYHYFNFCGKIKINKKLISNKNISNNLNSKFRIFKTKTKTKNKFLKKNNRIKPYKKFKKFKKFKKTKFNRHKLKWIYFSQFRVYQKHKISVKVNYLQKFYVSVLRIFYEKLTYFSNIYFSSFINFNKYNLLFNINNEYNELFFFKYVNFSLNLKNICLYLLFYNNFELKIKNFILFLNVNRIYYFFKKAFSINNLIFHVLSYLNSRKVNNIISMSKTNLYYILDKNKFLETYSSILKKIKVIIHKFKNLLTPYHYYFTEIKKYSNYRLPYLLYQNVYRSSIRVHAQTLVPLLMKDLGFLFIKPLQISIRLIRSSELTAGLLSRYIIFRLQRLYRLKDVVPPILEYFNRTNSFRGLRVDCAGRFDRNERATSLHFQTGKVPLNELTAQIEYSISTIRLKYGFCGIKVWLCKW